MPLRIREAVPADARAMAEIHVRSWQAAYRGQLTDDYLDGLSVEDRLEQHRRSLQEPPAEWRTWVAQDGERAPTYREEEVALYMKRPEIVLRVDLGIGDGRATVWTCDLTHGYIDINADYRS